MKLAPVKIQGRTVDMKITSYRAMAKCMPAEPTMAQIDGALLAQGGGGGGGSETEFNGGGPGDHGGANSERDGEERGAEDGGICFWREGAAERGTGLGEHDQCVGRDGESGAGFSVSQITNNRFSMADFQLDIGHWAFVI